MGGLFEEFFSAVGFFRDVEDGKTIALIWLVKRSLESEFTGELTGELIGEGELVGFVVIGSEGEGLAGAIAPSNELPRFEPWQAASPDANSNGSKILEVLEISRNFEFIAISSQSLAINLD